ncbi:polyprenyl synthetase family protein [Aureisphaera galaxeae]|uniref:polyprenyl synthetase family protein n=1 Tax=Aureisphaera galaxeae TaxID=1538023 RepID=UPI0023502384|nr:polyprenyl synthetase family protein [Aureisphaera galaxeae]MDC8006170.1 polyprenyl synthetase family protein [Aureisphaera galaxeae]
MKKIDVSQIKDLLLNHPIVNKWPEIATIINKISPREDFASWDYATWACTLVGGKEEDSLPATAANYCLLQSIHLVDDLLDEDPKGLHIKVGEGTAANLALVFQALGDDMILNASIPADTQLNVLRNHHEMMLHTAYGQNEDIQLDGSEEAYWRAVDLKTPPLFSSSLFVGALLGGADVTLATQLSELGKPVGRLIQVNDDLHDLLQVDDGPDWEQPFKNIALLYCLHADYPSKGPFKKLLIQPKTKEVILQLQQMLIESGAVSFCIYKMIEIYKEALTDIEKLPIEYQEKATALLKQYMDKIVALFNGLGIPIAYEELIDIA